MEHVVNALALSFSGNAPWLILVGTTLGIIGGAMPGIGLAVMLSVAIPFSYSMSATDALVLYAALYVGCGFGNGITATLIGIPGTPAATLNVIEGYPLHRRGEGGQALVLNLFAAVTGQLLGSLGFILLIVPLAAVAVYLLQPEVFALTILAFVAVVGIIGRDWLKGSLAILLGLGLATVGADPVSGQGRFTFGVPQLFEGFNLVAVLIGLLALGETFRLAAGHDEAQSRATQKANLGRLTVRVGELVSYWRMLAIGSVLGFIIGVVPGVGATTATFVAYHQARLWAKYPKLFGHGSKEAIVAMNAADNAVSGGEFVPTLGLGIPGSASQALLLGAFFIQGITPGPALLRDRPELVEAILGSMIVASIVMVPLGLALIRPSLFLTGLWPPAIRAGTVALTLTAAYAIQESMFDLYTALGFGILAYLLLRCGFPIAPVAISFVLERTMETALRRGLLIVNNEVLAFVTRPATLIMLLLALAVIVIQPYISRRRRQ